MMFTRELSLLTLCTGIFLFNIGTNSSQAAEIPMKQLQGHIPSIVAHLKPQGIVSPEREVSLAIGLPLRNREALTNLLEQVYDPSSTNYHCFLTSEQFAERFGPTEQEYSMVENFARVSGLQITGTYPNRMLLDVSGKASAVEKAFQVNLQNYSNPTDNRVFFAPDKEPSVPVSVPIQDISGLSNYRRPIPNYRFKSVTNSTSSVAPRVSPAPKATTGSGPAGNYIGDDFRNAYVPDSSLQGSGQTIALVQFDGYLSNDIVAYEQAAGRTNIPLQNVLIDGFSGVPTGNGGEVEVSLDIEMCVSMAPALANIIVYEGNPYNFHPNNVLNRIASDNIARQISCSWGWAGGPSVTTDQIFQQMALQGQTFFTASGDSDAYPAGSVDNPFSFGTPADSPYVTSVGGTTLTMNGAGGSYSSETVWNWGVRYPGGFYDGVGSSGGFSSYYTIPDWQTNINMAARGGSTTTRNFPDVALTADDVFVIADGGLQYIGVGGTSCAAPLWAGFMALVNEQAVNKGFGAIGFLNPAIYNIAKGASYTNCFHDTVTGNNTWSGSPDLFYATNNYDLATGLGTPNGKNLIDALTSAQTTNPITHITPPPPPYGSTLANLNGSNPNGTWQLFVQDDAAFNSGIISNGWYLSLTTANPVGFSADLDLAMAASTTNLSVSNYLTYTLTVTNYGPSVSSNVVVSDTMPLGAAFISSTAGQGSVMRSGQVLNWTVGELNPYSGSKLVFTVEPTGVGNINNYATATADTPDDNPANDFASITANVQVPTPPQLTGAYVAADGSFQFSVAGTPGVTNVIQASTNLVNWVNIYTNISPFTYTNMDTGSYPQEFYRAIAP
jgi:uncharacterized repeat protein (TIGR01451 family)